MYVRMYVCTFFFYAAVRFLFLFFNVFCCFGWHVFAVVFSLLFLFFLHVSRGRVAGESRVGRG